MQFLWEGLREAYLIIATGDPAVLDAAWRSLSISLTAVALASVCGVVIGAVLARRGFFGRGVIVVLFRAAMAFPTVFVGLVCYGLLSRQGPFGSGGLLFTPAAIVIAEFILALPIVVSGVQSALVAMDPRIPETAKTLGAGPLLRTRVYLWEIRRAVLLAMMIAFSRCVTELGAAQMVGGNIAGRTRTLSTATVLETSSGNFGRAIALGLILLAIALVAATIVGLMQHASEGADS